jgi:hypothetical protein
VVQAPQDDISDTGVNEPPAFQFPQQNPFSAAQSGQVMQPGTAFGQPTAFGTPMPPGSQPPVLSFGQNPNQGVSINPTPQQPAPVLQFPGMTNPAGAVQGGFGVVGAPTPGVIMQPAQPTQPGQPVRPPGGN